MTQNSERSRQLPLGKVPTELLRTVLDKLNVGFPVIVPPRIGVDVGIVKVSGKYAACSSDPLTGTSTDLGWHAVNVNANDIATSGIMPAFLTMVVLFPPSSTAGEIRKLILEINESARSLGISVVGGHTEVSSVVSQPLVMITAFGSGDSYVTASGGRPGDVLLMTKTAGIEGTCILSQTRKIKRILGDFKPQRGRKLCKLLSILPEARVAFNTGSVSGMHDATEGGIIGSVFEMSLASRVGFELFTDEIPVEHITREICEKLTIDPLKLLGSGSLLISCDKVGGQKIQNSIEALGIRCTKIGRFQDEKSGRWLYSPHGQRTELGPKDFIQDELWNLS